MIAVIGAGRCGTSLMMQTLDILGVPLLGNPQGRATHQLWQAYFKNKKELDPISVQHNAKGYYELSFEEIGGIIYGCPWSYEYGKAVKFTTDRVVDINSSRLEKVIFCKRKSLQKAAESMHLLAQSDLDYAKRHDLNSFANLYTTMTAKNWRQHMLMFNKLVESWLEDNDIPTLTVWFENMLENTEPTIQKVADFLEIDRPNLSAALKNVDKS